MNRIRILNYFKLLYCGNILLFVLALLNIFFNAARIAWRPGGFRADLFFQGMQLGMYLIGVGLSVTFCLTFFLLNIGAVFFFPRYRRVFFIIIGLLLIWIGWGIFAIKSGVIIP